MISLPWSAIGIAAFWISVGDVNPTLAQASVNSGITP